MKYISPGGWFSLEYPMGWHEFEDTEESFLFYNPDRWTGNFRISAYKDEAADYGPQCIAYELKENTSSTLVKVGKWDCGSMRNSYRNKDVVQIAIHFMQENLSKTIRLADIAAEVNLSLSYFSNLFTDYD